MIPDAPFAGFYLLVALIAYLIGSIPFGLVAARLFGLGDLRQIGSGNIGATNVLRTGHKPAALITLLGDAGKGAFAVVLARMISPDAALIAGFFAFLGHCFPVWLKFKGGKGVATFLGTVLALSFPVGLAACATWLLTAKLTRYSSLSALIAAAIAPVIALVLGQTDLAVLAALLAVLVFWRHHANIRRLLNGTEPRIGT